MKEFSCSRLDLALDEQQEMGQEDKSCEPRRRNRIALTDLDAARSWKAWQFMATAVSPLFRDGLLDIAAITYCALLLEDGERFTPARQAALSSIS